MANKKRLIDADAVMRKINAFAASIVFRGSNLMFTGKDSCNQHEYTRGYEQGVLDVQKILGGQPTVDAVEVKHGRWCWEGRFKACSECGSYVEWDETLGANFWKFCPYCGAKMDGGEVDG